MPDVRGAAGSTWTNPMYCREERSWFITVPPDIETVLSAQERATVIEVSEEVYKTWEEPLSEPPSESLGAESLISRITATYSQRLAEVVAADPRQLDKIEWRDLERLLAEVCTSLGFEVELTPSAKDGGKDIVLHVKNAPSPETYLIEIKHWRSGKKVGPKPLQAFIEVIARDGAEGGVFLSSSGFSEIQVQSRTELKATRLRLGDQTKIVSLCDTFVRAKHGLWQRPKLLTEVLFDGTVLVSEIAHR